MQGLVTGSYTTELWTMAQSKIIAALRTHSSYCTDPDLVLELKNLIVVFADTLQGYGFPVSRLFDLLYEVRNKYNETLLKKWAGLFRDIFEGDNYSPIPVANEEEYRAVISKFPFQDPDGDKGKVAQTACMSACKHLSTSLTQMLLDSELKQISMGAIQQFNLDVIQCEVFASSDPVPGFQEDTLQLAFIDLRQVAGCWSCFVIKDLLLAPNFYPFV
ncbi:exocyst complex component 6-like [Pseudophryne corroboree]|uniref:exocyst complex component 6-like n=1 Tax=Pseudophryne corroboree TaxID=495146 RepID=UPI003081DA43